jgi:hypothetical protein
VSNPNYDACLAKPTMILSGTKDTPQTTMNDTQNSRVADGRWTLHHAARIFA